MSKPEKVIDLNKNKDLVARMMAAQACYQLLQNQRPVPEVVQEYLERGMPIEMGADEDNSDIQIFKPRGILFKNIITNLHKRLYEIDAILLSSVKKSADQEAVLKPKEIEPLLKSIMLCGITELLSHQEIDTPIIVNDYIDVTHSFYGKGQAGFVNGILDNVARALRG